MERPGDVVIIGGGISGTAAAYELALRGVKATLLERGNLANMASGWTLAGVRQSGRHPAELPLAKAAVDRWPSLNEELGADIEYHQKGNLRLARTPEEVPEIRNVVETTRAGGIDIEYLPDNAAVRTIAPAISESVVGASFCPTDGHANPTKTVAAFAAAAERMGATIRTGVEVRNIAVSGGNVTGVETSDGRIPADVVIVTAGIYTPGFLAPFDLDLPIRIVLTAVLQSVPMEPVLDQVLGVAGGDLAIRQQEDGRLRGTGGSRPWEGTLETIASNYDAVQPPAWRISDAINRISHVFPAFGQARLARVWGGLIDQSPDALPVYERATSPDGLVYTGGFSGHGFGIGPSTGVILADLVTNPGDSLPIEPFGIERFAEIEAPENVTLHG